MLNGLHILVVEDNPLNQKIVSFILSKQRATVKMALNGKEAINLLSAEAYDAVLMDLQMPEMDGHEAIKYIRHTLKSDVPIIALTASLFDETDDDLSAGMDAIITKPVNAAGLCNLILNLTEQHNAKFQKTAV